MNTRGNARIYPYNINPKFSGALIELNGKHGKIKCIGEDRIYFIIEGSGKVVLNGKESKVEPYDLIFVPKNTPYDMEGKMKYFLVCSPEFRAEDDVSLKE